MNNSFTGFHVACGFLGCHEYAGDVYGDHLLVNVLGSLRDRPAYIYSRVVDQYIEATKRANGLGDGFAHRIGFAGIGGNSQR